MNSKKEVRYSVGAASDDLDCPLCESKSIETLLHSDAFKYGSGDSAVTLRVENLPVRRCVACDLEFIDHEGARLRHEAVCRHLGVLTPAEVREARERYGMTRAAFAEATGLGEATLGRWETAALIQNRANDIFLRLVRLPFVMSILQLWSTRRCERVRESDTSGRSFRRLVVNESLLQAQKNFRLRLEGFQPSS